MLYCTAAPVGDTRGLLSECKLASIPYLGIEQKQEKQKDKICFSKTLARNMNLTRFKKVKYFVNS